MKKWLWIFLIALSLKAQNTRLFIQHSTVDPTGACTGTSLWINDTGGRIYACINHAWVLLGTSAGSITGGPFTLNQFVLGNGGQDIKTVTPTLGAFTQDNTNGQELVIKAGLNSAGWIPKAACTGLNFSQYNPITNVE